MKSAVAGCLILIFSIQAFYTAGVAVWFHLNRAYIASALCENKAKPEKKCAGNCVLNKKAGKAENRSDKTENNRTVQWVEISPCLIEQPDLLTAEYKEATVKYPTYHSLYQFEWRSNIFHPPLVF
jgi:hypothetical protein